MSQEKLPKRLYNISHGFLSIARYSGAAIVFGKRYIYDPSSDTLIREDIFKKEQTEKKKPKSGSSLDIFEELFPGFEKMSKQRKK